VNCAAIPRDLIASELFGHREGGVYWRSSSDGSAGSIGGRRNDLPGRVGELASDTQVALAEGAPGT